MNSRISGRSMGAKATGAAAPARYGLVAGAPLSGRGRRPLEADARQLGQPDELDQSVDMRRGALQVYAESAHAQATGEHRDIDHQRGIREGQLAQVYDHVG